MTRRGAGQYRKVQLESASPQRLLLEVYRRLGQDLEQIRRCLASQDVQGKARAVDHALALLGELELALDHAAAPALCLNLATIYGFCRAQLLLASARLDPAPLDEVAKALAPISDAFQQLIEPPAPTRPPRP